MAKKKVVAERYFPLINQINNFDLFNNNEAYNFKIPDYIRENLKHTLRDYQAKALFNLNWSQIDDQANHLYNHLMFNMATGSGKTDLMAAIMLYMYAEFGYQEFLFVANSNAVVSKTQENFLNESSAKYLFNAPLTIAGQRIDIRAVDRFPLYPEQGTIYLKLTTIQSLANELGSYRENGLTYDDLAKRELVILADEAHHFNASTKKEKVLETSWEQVLNRVRGANENNRQFEFTATIDVSDDAVYEKYKHKIIYKYELNRFMNDGFSKNVRRLESNQDDRDKMMNAVLLSQYRKRLAKENQIQDFKPVILFKSNRIKDSDDNRDAFLEMMADLTVNGLQNFIVDHLSATKSTTLTKVYEYWLNEDLNQTVAELKRDFQKLTTINVNDGNKNLLDDRADFNNLNTLEDPNNPLRTVFAVAKLTEGWDVLNLYDIVRLGEKVSSVKETNQEAQLIGRGARYYPFIYDGKSSFTRRFDDDINRNLLETLFYHTINDPTYLKRLHGSLNKLNLVSENDERDSFAIYTATVKPRFTKTKFFKSGNLYQNELEVIPDEDYDNINKYGINAKEIFINLDKTINENELNDDRKNHANTEERLIASFSSKADRRLIKKAVARESWFRFANIKQYLPVIKSMDEFLYGTDWLGNLRIKGIVVYGAPSLTIEERCEAVQQALSRIKKQIITNYRKQRGTNVFKPVPVHEIIIDYQKKVSNSKTGNGPDIRPYEKTNDDWFVYDVAIVDQLEDSFINMIRGFINDTNLKEKYNNVYLLRIEERINKFKLYEYLPIEESHYQAYMPDFVLCLDDGKVNYQIFVEPKGANLLIRDQWKQDLLESLDSDKLTIIGENDDVRLMGVKFYVNDDGKRDIRGTQEELKTKLAVHDLGI